MLATARALTVDRFTSEVVGALERDGIPSVLLKGPVLQQWLYDDGAPRGYGDADILVPPDHVDRAVSVLDRLGFGDRSLEGVPHMRPNHARTFFRASDGATVDLHETIPGATADAREVWHAVSSSATKLRVGGRLLDASSRPVAALHAALHAAHHGVKEPRPLEDLRRAVARASPDVWLEAEEIARTIGALAPLHVGLRLVPEGERVRAALRTGDVPIDPAVRLRATTPPKLAEGFAWLSTQKGLRTKAVIVFRRLFPPPQFMRVCMPVARRGRLGLVLSYPWRLVSLAWHAPAGLRAWLRAKGQT